MRKLTLIFTSAIIICSCNEKMPKHQVMLDAPTAAQKKPQEDTVYYHVQNYPNKLIEVVNGVAIEYKRIVPEQKTAAPKKKKAIVVKKKQAHKLKNVVPKSNDCGCPEYGVSGKQW
jgi:hypothetical protein